MYHLEELTAPALRNLLDRGVSVAVMPFGSIEHHGGHLAIGADAVVADAVGREVAQELGAVLAPTVRVGDAEQHVQFASTMSLRAGTLVEVTVELVEGLARSGFRLIVLVCTRGGNRAALDTAVARVCARSGGPAVCAPPGDVDPRRGRIPVDLTSVMLALRPELVELENAAAELASELEEATAERGARHIERFVASIVEGVRPAGQPA
jgi:creatinine amidohydrolase/Fe(II)-dependent formamide hydrolase-like protein